MECQTQRLQDQVAELQERLARAERVAAERVSGDPEVRDLLLYYFGTTEPHLLADAWKSIAELQERLAAAQRAFREAYDGGTKAIEERNRYKAMLQQIADDNPPLSAFRAKYGDIEAFENSDNTGDVAMAAMYRMAASIGDKARAALGDSR